MLRLCFVCLGNICRSPTAEGIMLKLVSDAGLSSKFEIDSAGTAAYHIGKRPDPRTLKTAKARGVALPSIARAFNAADFARFDYVLAMDAENRKNLLARAPSIEDKGKVHLLRSFEPGPQEGAPGEGARDVPDPYYGGPEGFEDVFDICEAACHGLLAHLRKVHAL